MDHTPPIDCPGTPEEAEGLQTRLAAEVRETPLTSDIKTIAGVDVAYSKTTDQLVAAVCLLDASDLTLIETAFHVDEARFPYVSGLFSFRELPPVLAAMEKLTARPDAIICDGQGRAHPRRFGLACHLGLTLSIPTLGCGKTHLFGEYSDPGSTRGDWSAITHGDETIGAVLRTQTDTNPVFVSIGHLMTLDDAIRLTLAASPRYRLPETTRAADHAVKVQLKSIEA